MEPFEPPSDEAIDNAVDRLGYYKAVRFFARCGYQKAQQQIVDQLSDAIAKERLVVPTTTETTTTETTDD
jgi:hypothetical protein